MDRRARVRSFLWGWLVTFALSVVAPKRFARDLRRGGSLSWRRVLAAVAFGLVGPLVGRLTFEHREAAAVRLRERLGREPTERELVAELYRAD